MTICLSNIKKSRSFIRLYLVLPSIQSSQTFLGVCWKEDEMSKRGSFCKLGLMAPDLLALGRWGLMGKPGLPCSFCPGLVCYRRVRPGLTWSDREPSWIGIKGLGEKMRVEEGIIPTAEGTLVCVLLLSSLLIWEYLTQETTYQSGPSCS